MADKCRMIKKTCSSRKGKTPPNPIKNIKPQARVTTENVVITKDNEN